MPGSCDNFYIYLLLDFSEIKSVLSLQNDASVGNTSNLDQFEYNLKNTTTNSASKNANYLLANKTLSLKHSGALNVVNVTAHRKAEFTRRVKKRRKLRRKTNHNKGNNIL